LLEAETVVEPLRQPFKPGALEVGVVIAVQIVDSDDLVAAIEQGTGRGCADETCNARDQYCHVPAHRGGGGSVKVK